MGLISRSLFVGGGVTYPSRDEVLMSLQVPTGDRDTLFAGRSCASPDTRILTLPVGSMLCTPYYHTGHSFPKTRLTYLGDYYSGRSSRAVLALAAPASAQSGAFYPYLASSHILQQQGSLVNYYEFLVTVI